MTFSFFPVAFEKYFTRHNECTYTEQRNVEKADTFICVLYIRLQTELFRDHAQLSIR
jgi:hypothetical protein